MLFMKGSGEKTAKESTPKSVGIWIRVSTDDQAEGESPSIHEHRAREYAKFNGWNVVEVYNLAGVSGKTVMEHAEAKRMMADIRRKHISGLIFSKLARLARNTKELLEFADFFKAQGADIVSLQERIDTSSPAGRLFYTMIAAMAQWEREEITDRIKASIRTRAQLGKSLGGAAPFGYQWLDSKLIPHPKEAPIRKVMFEWFAEDRRFKSVARRLNAAGYRTRNGSKFTDTTVVRLIQDPSAKGLYRSNHTYRDAKGHLKMKPESEWCHNPIEPIVDEELWQQCNAILTRRKDRKQLGPKPIHLFAGLLTCSCGQSMYVFSRTAKYLCSKCRTKIPMEDIEEIFREELRAFFVSQDRVQEHLQKANEHLTQKRNLLQVHQKELEKVRGEMKKVYNLYQADQISADGFGKLYSPLEKQEQGLEAELPKLQGQVDALEVRQASTGEVVEEALNLHRVWPELDMKEKRNVIESIVEEIVISHDEIDIKLYALESSTEFTKWQRNLLATLPFDRQDIRVQRSRYLPLSNRKVPVPRNPTTIGGQLRRRRLQLGLLQREVAQKLGVSMRTLSLWECDKVYPMWEYQPRIAAYLGHNPFTDPEMGRPHDNKSIIVVNLTTEAAMTFGDNLREVRLKHRLSRVVFAKQLGVNTRTLRNWEMGIHAPLRSKKTKIEAVIGRMGDA